jgi:hypothetical protein
VTIIELSKICCHEKQSQWQSNSDHRCTAMSFVKSTKARNGAASDSNSHLPGISDRIQREGPVEQWVRPMDCDGRTAIEKKRTPFAHTVMLLF